MSTTGYSPPLNAGKDMAYNGKDSEKLAVGAQETDPTDYDGRMSLDAASSDDLLGQQDVDPALNAKMRVVNDAIDLMGWTPYHTKLFFLNGFGYAVDSLILLLQSIISTTAIYEFNPAYPKALTIAVYVGMLVGALFWGLGADIIGRKFAFNVSLFICSIAGIAAGAAPSWISLAFFISMVGFGGGGNLILDTAVFLEYLPSKYQWVLTFLAAWWGVGQFVAGVVAWGFLTNPSMNCASATNCTYGENMGWRYVMYTCSALVFVMSLLRVTVIRLVETPKFLLGEGKDEELVQNFHNMAKKYNRPCTITVDQLARCGVVSSSHKKGLGEYAIHFRGLFATKKMGLSTVLIWLSWTLIGLAYPLYYVFLNSYLSSRGGNFTVTTYESWRNYALVNVCGIPGPMLAGYMANWRVLGRRYTMVIGAIVTMAFFFGLTQITNATQNVALSCVVGFTLNIYYGTLYAYTPEVLPSAHRATGNGVAVACNRIMGILSAVIATVANTSTPVPIFICAVLYLAMAAVAIAFPFEPYGKRSS